MALCAGVIVIVGHLRQNGWVCVLRIPSRSLDSRRESTKTPGAGDASTGHPGWGVPEHIRAMRSFPRRMHNVALLSPVASLDCAYFLSPRGCTPTLFLRFLQTRLARRLRDLSTRGIQPSM